MRRIFTTKSGRRLPATPGLPVDTSLEATLRIHRGPPYSARRPQPARAPRRARRQGRRNATSFRPLFLPFRERTLHRHRLSGNKSDACGAELSMRVLLTGATGFLGRALARRFAEAGHQVVALVRETTPTLPISVSNRRSATSPRSTRSSPLRRLRGRRALGGGSRAARAHRRLLRCQRARNRERACGLRDRRRAMPRVHLVRRRRHRSRRSQRRQRDARAPQRAPSPISRRRRWPNATGPPRTAPSSRRWRCAASSGARANPACCRDSPRSREAADCAFSVSPARRSTAATSTTQPTRISPRSIASNPAPRSPARRTSSRRANRLGRRFPQQPAARGGLSGRDAPTLIDADVQLAEPPAHGARSSNT